MTCEHAVVAGHGGHSHDGPQRIAKPRPAWLTLTGMVAMFVGCGLQDLIGKWA